MGKLPMAKSESVILNHRAANHKSANVLDDWRRRACRIEVVSRVEVAVLQVVIGVTMEVVRAAFRDDLNLRAGIAPILGVEIIGNELELLKRVHTEGAELGSSR